MGDFKTMSEAEIIARKDNYLKGLNDLIDKISYYLLKQRHSQAEKDETKTEYRDLKSRIGEETKILRTVRGSIRYISRTHANYEGGIVEANAEGFTVSINGRISEDMYHAVSDAECK